MQTALHTKTYEPATPKSPIELDGEVLKRLLCKSINMFFGSYTRISAKYLLKGNALAISNKIFFIFAVMML